MRNNIIYLNTAATKPISQKSLAEYNLIAQKSHLYTTRAMVSKNQYYDIIENARNTAKNLVEGNCIRINFLNTSTHIANILAQKFIDCSIAYSDLDHHSFSGPFINQSQTNVKLKLDSNLYYDLETNSKIFNEIKPDILLVTPVDNILGQTSNYLELISLYRSINPTGIIIVDAAQAINYIISFKKVDYDYMFASVHKIAGPLGLGILWINNVKDKNNSYLGGGNILKIDQDKLILNMNTYMIGTINIAAIAGFIPAGLALINEKNSVNLSKILNNKQLIINKLSKIKNIIIHQDKSSNYHICFSHSQIHSHDIVQYLANNNVITRAGNHCNSILAEAISPNSSVRISFDYTLNIQQIEALMQVLEKINCNYLNYLFDDSIKKTA